MGARVIKVERPGAGDETRINVHQLEPGRTDQSSYFARVNAGKESVAVDLSSPDGLKVVLDLAGHADVFIENFAPGVVGRLGCDYKAVSAVKPDVVYCSISGFGQTGPWRHKQAFAHITNAISGLMATIGYIKMEEVPGIPRLAEPPGVVVYAPLGDVPVDPDVVLFAGRPGRVMLLQEAALRAGVRAQAPLLGRPTCM